MSDRRQHIGASETAAVLGLGLGDDPEAFETPAAVWARKVYGVEAPATLPMQLGTICEPLVMAEFKRRYPDAEPGPKFEEDPFTFGILASHPDARAPGLVGDLKVITSTGDKWHGIPTRYYVQLLTQALTVRESTGERIDRAVLLSLHLDLHLEFRCQEVTLTPADWARAESIADYCARWWRDYVVTRKTPPNTVVDGGFIDLPTPGSVRVATDAEAALCAHIRRLQLEAKVTEHALKDAQRTLRTMMGPTATLTHNGRKVATLSRSTATRINPAIVRALSPEIAQAATTHTEQVRLLVKDVP